MRRFLLSTGAVTAALLLGGLAVAQSVDPSDARQPPTNGQMRPGGTGPGANGMRPGGMGAGRGMNGMGPGMMRGSATMAERSDIHALLFDHERITRSVANLPNGIRTLTESDDPEVAAAIKRHVADMGKRVEEGRDPGMPIESAALRSLFPARNRIKSTYEVTAKGYAVTQTSNDPAVVKALQAHAAEVSDLAERGMVAAHEAMMKNASGTARGGMGQAAAQPQP